jgi:hypothetical protein
MVLSLQFVAASVQPRALVVLALQRKAGAITFALDRGPSAPEHAASELRDMLERFEAFRFRFV